MPAHSPDVSAAADVDQLGSTIVLHLLPTTPTAKVLKRPKLGFHKASGQFLVTIKEKHHYLGKDEAIARVRYQEVIKEFWDTLPQNLSTGLTCSQVDRISLAGFCEQFFYPIKLRGRSRGYLDCFRGSLAWLAKALGREPTLVDLSRSSLLWLMRYLADAKLGQLRVRAVRKHFCSVWQFANRLGLAVAYDPPPLLRIRKARRRWLNATARLGTLLRYYRNTFRPQLVAIAAQQTIGNFDTAINRFHDYVEKQVRVEDIRPELLPAFGDWLAQSQMTTKEIGRQVEAVRRVLRAAQPGRWEQRNAGERKFLACEPAPTPPASAARNGVGPRPPLPQIGGEPGTLAHFFLTVYAPEELITSLPRQALNYCKVIRFMRECWGRDLLVSELNEARVAEYRPGSSNAVASPKRPSIIVG